MTIPDHYGPLKLVHKADNCKILTMCHMHFLGTKRFKQGQLYYMDVDLIFRYLDRGPLFSDTNCTPPKLILHPFNDTKL